MQAVAVDRRFFVENGPPGRHAASFDKSPQKKTLGDTTAARLLHMVAKCMHAALHTHHAVLSNSTHGQYAVTFPQTVFAVKVEGIILRCSNRDALEPSQRELVDEVLAPVRNLDAPVLTRNNGGSFNAKLVSAGLEPFSIPKAAPQATRAEPEEAPVAAPEARSPKRARREEQTPEPQPWNLETTVARYKQLRLTQFDTHRSYYTLVRMRERGLNEESDDFTEEFHRLRDFVARDFLAQP